MKRDQWLVPVRIGGIQPVYLPWLGYFDQIMRVDAFVIADEMPYTSSGWLHRNRVRGPDGPHWLTLPARPRRAERIDEVRVDPRIPWKRKHLTTLRHFYAGGVEVEPTLDALAGALDPGAVRLVEITVPVIRLLAERLDLRTPLLLSSELGLEERYRQRFPDRPGPTQRIIAYMEALGARELLEGESGQAYFDVGLFRSFGFEVRFHRYVHPEYHQIHTPFHSHMSVIDLLLSEGIEEARRVLRRGRLRCG